MTKPRFTGLYLVVQLHLQDALERGLPETYQEMIIPAARRYHTLDAMLAVWRGETPLSGVRWSYRKISSALRDITGIDASNEAIRNWDRKRLQAAREAAQKAGAR